MLTVACVLKTGGDYDTEYVLKLAANVQKNLTIPLGFICLTDLRLKDTAILHKEGISTIPLVYSLPGWWSKMELFGREGAILAIDLDTIITGDITPLAEAVLALEWNKQVMMLKRFRYDAWATGIMGWRGNYRWLLHEFFSQSRGCTWVTNKRGAVRMEVSKDEHYKGDQNWTGNNLESAGIDILPVQDFLPRDSILSYKHHLMNCNFELPSEAKIVCFHGKPRPAGLPIDHVLRKYW